MKKLAVAVLGLALVAGAAYGQTVVGSKHDLSTGGVAGTYRSTNISEVCVFCHTPHQASAANMQDPLWNHTFPTGPKTYGVYSSATLNATPGEVFQAVGTASTSMLCMSCHDGSVGVGNLYNNPNNPAGGEFTPSNSAVLITGNANLGGGNGHQDDHPVNFTYNTALATADGGLKDPAVTPAVAALLFSGTVQCASCHDAHNPTNAPFLVMSNGASALCTTCHNK